MTTQKLQARPAAAVASAGPAASDFVDDADQTASRPLFASASLGSDTGGAAPVEETPFVSSASPLPFAVASQTADLSAVRPLASAASSEPALIGSGFTYRHNWGARRGQWKLLLNIGGATARSRVMVSIGEGAGALDLGKFIGGARFTLHNVAPRAGGIDVWVNVEWGADIPLYIDYLIVNP